MPVDDKIFHNMNDFQMLWYQIQISLDEKEDFEFQRDLMEHNAMFSNPEGVSKVREARKNTYTVPTSEFKELIKEQFGKDIDFNKEGISPEQMLSENKVKNQINTYLDMELDEVKFIPGGN